MEIPYLQMQGCLPLMAKNLLLNKMNYNELARHIVNSPYVAKFKNTFIGWPVNSRIGGYSFDDLLEDEHRLSEEDSHPNKRGHEIVAEVLYDNSKKISS
jgi:hypothetical protein